MKNMTSFPCHIFLVVHLHEQISDLTIFPCQGKASMPDFPWQGKFVHYSPSTRAIFPCQGKLVKENCSCKWGFIRSVKYNNNTVFSFVSRCGHLWGRSRRFDCILLVFIRRWGRLVTRHLLSRVLRCDWLVFSSCDWCISTLTVSVCCSFGGPLSYGSPVH